MEDTKSGFGKPNPVVAPKPATPQTPIGTKSPVAASSPQAAAQSVGRHLMTGLPVTSAAHPPAAQLLPKGPPARIDAAASEAPPAEKKTLEAVLEEWGAQHLTMAAMRAVDQDAHFPFARSQLKKLAEHLKEVGYAR